MDTKNQTITINGVDYTADQLNDEQKILINHVADLDVKINAADFGLTQLRVGREAFMNMLVESLKNQPE
jgi:hypothetical protein